MIIIYITCKDEKEAKNISKHLLQRKLIACSNIFQARSLYRWKGRMQDCREFVLLAKTKENKYNTIKKEVRKLHSYGIPCILKIKADANKEYNGWVNHEVK